MNDLRPALGDILVEEQLISATQLDQAKRVANRSGSSLVGTLLDQGLLGEQELFRALRRRTDLELFDPQIMNVEGEAVREVPHDEATRFRLLPVQLHNRDGQRVLRVAMADPLDAQAIEEIEFSTGCVVQPLIARPSKLTEAIRNHYRNLVTRVIPRPQSPRHKARSGRVNPLRTPDDPRHPKAVSDWAEDINVVQRLEALIELLAQKGLISRDEYQQQLRELKLDQAD